MNCNIDLHNEILESGELTCPFCNESLDNPKTIIIIYVVNLKILLMIIEK